MEEEISAPSDEGAESADESDLDRICKESGKIRKNSMGGRISLEKVLQRRVMIGAILKILGL